VQIAVVACQREIINDRCAAMLPRHDMFDVKSKVWIVVLMDVAVFAPVASAVANEVAERRFHSGRGVSRQNSACLRLKDGDDGSGGDECAVLRFVLRGERPFVACICEFVDASLSSIIGTKRDQLTRHLRRDRLADRFKHAIEQVTPRGHVSIVA
jgi:hypothetical protein